MNLELPFCPKILYRSQEKCLEEGIMVRKYLLIFYEFLSRILLFWCKNGG